MNSLLQKFLVLILFCACALKAQNFTDVPLSVSGSASISSTSGTLESARRALSLGVPEIARTLSENILDSSETAYAAEARLLLIDALISESKFESAALEIAKLNLLDTSDILLRKAIVASRTSGEILNYFDEIKFDELSESLRPWYFVLQGRNAFEKSDFKGALKAFEEAKKNTQSAVILSEIDILMNLASLANELNATDLNALANDLSLKTSIYMGMPAGAQYVKQYALVLNKLSRKKEALEAIENTLEASLLTDIDRDELRLIGAYIESSLERKRSMLLQILKSTNSPDIVEQAIRLLRFSHDKDSTDYFSILTDALENASPLVKDRILLELSYLSLRKKDFSAVKFYADKLLLDYPASRYASDAYRVLALGAYTSVDAKKPNYKLTASYLMKLVSLEKNKDIIAMSKFIAADCYFLDGDFETAGGLYKSLLESELAFKWRSSAFSRAIECLLNTSKINEAIALADSAYAKIKIAPSDIWKAEWTIASFYKEKNQPLAELVRIESLLTGAASATGDVELRARLFWLQARFVENSGDYSRALTLTENLIKSLSDKTLKLKKDSADLILSNTMLMRARILTALDILDGNEGAFAAYENLRKAFPVSEAAQISYLYEARSFARRGAYAQAQQHCKTLADNFPNGKYADIALFEAAIYSKKLGLESDYKDALTLLSRLVDNYSKSQKSFYAKLGQAEILRVLGDFSAASALYKNIETEFPTHPQIVAAYIGSGDCLLAQAGQESAAASVFEKIYLSPDIPDEARAEVMFKWGFALNKADRRAEAVKVWWFCVNDFLKNRKGKTENVSSENKSDLASKERYWVARTLIQLARIFEQTKEKDSAIAVYEMLLKYDLPGSNIAVEKLLNYKGK